MGLSKFGRRRECGFEIDKRFGRPVEAAKRMATIGQDLRMTGHRRKCPVIAGYGLDGLVEPQKRIASVDERAGMARVFSQHRIEVCKRFIDAAELETGIAEIVENFRMIRRNLQRGAIPCDRLLEALRRVKRQSKIGHRFRGAGIDPKRLREKAKRLDVAMAPEVENAKQMKRLEILGPVFENSGA